MEIRIFPSQDSCFTLWEDAGDLPMDEDDNWVSTQLSWKENTFTIHAAQGNTSVIPEKRSWKLVFSAVENILAENTGILTITADGKCIDVEAFYEEECHALIVKIPSVAVGMDVAVSFNNTLRITRNSKQLCYAALMRAHMDYDLNSKIWNLILADNDDLKSSLMNLDMDENVRACLFEFI